MDRKLVLCSGKTDVGHVPSKAQHNGVSLFNSNGDFFFEDERNVDQLIVPDKGPQDGFESAKAKNNVEMPDIDRMD